MPQRNFRKDFSPEGQRKSDPPCDAGGMQSNDATEPLDVQQLRRSLGEWAAISSHMIELLQQSADCGRTQNWRPHLTQIVAAVDAFGERCRREAEAFGCWRTDELELEEILESVRDQGQRLVAWLQRIMAE